jgi:hypothetical protein
LSGSFANNRFTVTRGAQTDTALNDLRTASTGQAQALRGGAAAISGFIPQFGELRTRLGSLGQRIGQGISGLRGEVANLRGQLKPGFGNLTRSRVEELRNNRGRAVGNLREELSRRRVLGSSFALREIGSLESEFARQEDLIRSESMLQEIDATNQLISQELGMLGAEAEIESGLVGQEGGFVTQQAGIAGSQYELIARSFDASIAAAQQILNQLNLETSLASGLGESASNLINANLTAQAQARAAQEAGSAEFLGTIIGAFAPG